MRFPNYNRLENNNVGHSKMYLERNIYSFLAVLSASAIVAHLWAMAEISGYEKLNEDVAGWAKYQAQRLRRQVGSLTLKDKHAIRKALWHKKKDAEYKSLEKTIGSGNKKDFGRVTRVNFRFARQGVYLEHGTGRGRKVRSAAATPKPWLKPILDPAIDELADLIAANYADIAAGEIKFFAPGILNRRIQIKNG